MLCISCINPPAIKEYNYSPGDVILTPVSRDTFAVKVPDGYVEYGKQIPYEKQPGDRVQENPAS